MSLSLHYLEEAKIEELAHEYERQGYSVSKNHRDADVVYDLVANNGQRKVAIEVQARAALAGRADQITRQREVAQKHGYNFQLFIVNPPLEKQIVFEEINTLLFQYFIDHIPDALDQLSSHTSIDHVGRVEISAITVTRAGVHVAGTGMVEVTLEYGSGENRDGMSWSTSFPFDFAIAINHQFEIVEIENLAFDTSSFDG